MSATTFTSGTTIASNWLNKVDDVLNVPSTNTPTDISDMVFELTSNTTLKIKVKGSDGVVRSVSLTLA